MSYQVLARKWRPQNFGQLVGQEHVKTALTHALSQNRLHHAYLFTGTRGVGKTTIARIFAKSLNCEQGVTATPCGVCSACREIDQGFFVDLLEIDAASRTKVEDTRDLLDNVQYAPTRGRYKVYLIDEVHMLSRHSFNALLKTLEEPPPHVKFLLATTDPQKLPITVLSRCLQFSLKALSQQQIKQHLTYILAEEQIAADDDALALLARAAKGSLRDSLSLTDQAIAQTNGNISLGAVREMLGLLEQSWAEVLLQDVLNRDLAGMQQHLQQLVSSHSHFHAVLDDMLSLLHLAALSQYQLSASELALTESAFVRAVARQYSAESVQLYYQLLLSGKRDLPYAPEPRIGLEMALLRAIAFVPAADAGAATPVQTGRAAALSAAGVLPEAKPETEQRAAPDTTRMPASTPPASSASASTTAAQQPPVAEMTAVLPETAAVTQDILIAADAADLHAMDSSTVAAHPLPPQALQAPQPALSDADTGAVAPPEPATAGMDSVTASILARRGLQAKAEAEKKPERQQAPAISPTINQQRVMPAVSRQTAEPASVSQPASLKSEASRPAMTVTKADVRQPAAPALNDIPPWEELPAEPANLTPQQPVQLLQGVEASQQTEPSQPAKLVQEVWPEPGMHNAGPDDDEDSQADDMAADWQWQQAVVASAIEPLADAPQSAQANAAQPIRHALLESLAVAEEISTDFASEAVEEVVSAVAETGPLTFEGVIDANNFAVRQASQVDAWAQRIDSLRIGGLMRLFLLHSSIEQQGEQLKLTVAASQRHLDSERNRAQLAAVLSESFGQPLQIDIEFTEQVPASPQAIQQRIEVARRRYVSQLLQQDPTLNGLLQEFAGEWLPESLEVF